ncbi:MAG: alpha/beta hydrolase [bacterium]|nr:alpha/beta hydrolase [bacterium]
MKKVYIIHGWGGRPDTNWLPWLKKELEKYDEVEVSTLDMPDTDNPVIERWVRYLKKEVPNPDENTYFVGHSIGCQAIMRYIESFDDIKIGGALFVAGWFYLDNLDEEEVKIREPWLKVMDLEKIKKQIGHLTVLLSTNDDYGCLKENSREFKKLDANIIIEENAGHFTDEKHDRILEETLALTGLTKIT